MLNIGQRDREIILGGVSSNPGVGLHVVNKGCEG